MRFRSPLLRSSAAGQVSQPRSISPLPAAPATAPPVTPAHPALPPYADAGKVCRQSEPCRILAAAWPEINCFAGGVFAPGFAFQKPVSFFPSQAAWSYPSQCENVPEQRISVCIIGSKAAPCPTLAAGQPSSPLALQPGSLQLAPWQQCKSTSCY